MVHGNIHKLNETKFVWMIRDFYNLSLDSKVLFSPDFHYKDIPYFFEAILSTRRIVDSNHKISCRIDTSVLTFATHWLTIVVNGGEIVGPIYSKIVGEFKNFNVGDLRRLSPSVSLKFHVTFLPPTTQQPDRQEEGNSISPTTNLQLESSCSCSSVGMQNILENFKNLLLSGQASDVTFNVKGTEIKAHKAVLRAQSEVFGKMFDSEMVENISGIVKIADFEPEDFHAFLLYLYTARVERPTVERAVELYCLAKKYNVDVLGPYCVQFLLSNWSVESFCGIVSLGLLHSETELLDSAISFLHENMKQIVCSPNWKAFNKENPDEATEILMKAFSHA